MLAGDVIIFFLGLGVVFWLDYRKISPDWEIQGLLVIAVILAGFIFLTFYILGLYEPVRVKRPDILLLSISLALGTLLIFYSSLAYFFPVLRPGKIILVVFTLLIGALTFAWRQVFVRIMRPEPQRILFIGNNKLIRELDDFFTSQLPAFYRSAGQWHRSSHNPTLPDLEKYVQENNIDIIVYSVHSQILQDISPDLINIRFKQKNIFDCHNFYQLVTGKFPIHYMDDFWMLMNSQREIFFPGIKDKIKRVFDVCFALILMPVALPLILLAAAAIRLESKGSALFIQERLGRNEVPFRLYKLRTMVENAEQLTGPKWSEEDDPRITKIGRILRKLRMDELPQIFNVLKGDMSVIGPRPIRRHFADLLDQELPYYRLRFLVKPGLTGWAQVNYDYAGSMEGQSQKLQYELYYLIHQSFLLDLYIVLKTIRVMVWGKGM